MIVSHWIMCVATEKGGGGGGGDTTEASSCGCESGTYPWITQNSYVIQFYCSGHSYEFTGIDVDPVAELQLGTSQCQTVCHVTPGASGEVRLGMNDYKYWSATDEVSHGNRTYGCVSVNLRSGHLYHGKRVHGPGNHYCLSIHSRIVGYTRQTRLVVAPGLLSLHVF